MVFIGIVPQIKKSSEYMIRVALWAEVSKKETCFCSPVRNDGQQKLVLSNFSI